MWQAREDYWNYLKGLLESSVGIQVSSTAKTDHSAISKSIEEFSKNVPDSAYYYAYIFVFDEQSSEPARGLSGLLFKNKLRASVDCLDEKQVEELIQILQKPLISLLSKNSHRSSFIQRTVGSILSTLITDCNGLIIWPSLFEELMALCGENSYYAFSAIEIICEDAAFELIEHPHIFEPFVKSVLNSLKNDLEDERMKNFLLSILFHLVPTQSSLLTENINFIIDVVKGTNSENIRITSCKLFSSLIEFCWTFFQVEDAQLLFKVVIQWTLESSNSTESRDLLKQCLEFWLFQVQSDYAIDVFQCVTPEVLSQLIPLLIDRCSYDEEEDEEELCKALEDLSVPDEEDELKPRHHKVRENINNDKFNKDTSEDNNEDYDDDNDAIVSSIRKCSAATLDGLSLAIHDLNLFLQIFLPSFNDRVGSNDWKLREGALLAFGAIVEGLWQHLTPHLDQIVSYLLANAHSHPHPLVRSMSIWTLSRISVWICDSSFKSECLGILIGSLRDSNKRVQQSSATALCTFLEDSSCVLSVEEGKSLISAIFLALKCYQKRSLLIIYDLIRIIGNNSTFKNVLSFDSEAIQYLRSISVILIDNFGPESISDSSIFPIIEALMSLVLCDFDGHLLDLNKRDELNFKALNLAAQNLSALTSDLSAEIIVSDGLDDFLIAALDLLASAVESSKLAPSPQLFPLLRDVLAASLLFEKSSNVRQSAFALVGDYAEFQEIFTDVSLISVYFEALEKNILPSTLDNSKSNSTSTSTLVSMSTASNAIWSLGEFVLRSKAFGEVDKFASLLFDILNERKTLEVGARIYFENVAVCLGRILRISSSSNSIGLNNSVLFRIFNLLSTVESDLEKYTSISGYIRVLRQNHSQITPECYGFVVSKINELIDFSQNLSDPLLCENISGFVFKEIDPSFYNSLQPNFKSILMS